MIKLWGESDDLVEVESANVRREIDCHDRSVTFAIGEEEASPNEDASGLLVRFRYGPAWNDAPCWTAEICQLDECIAVPWPVKVTDNGRHSVVVEIDCPDATPVKWEVSRIEEGSG